MAFELLTHAVGRSFYLTDEAPPTFTAPQGAVAVYRDAATDAVAVYQSPNGTDWRMYVPGVIPTTGTPPAGGVSGNVGLLVRVEVDASEEVEVLLPAKVIGSPAVAVTWRVARSWLVSDDAAGTVEIRRTAGGAAFMTLTPGAVGTVVRNTTTQAEGVFNLNTAVYVAGDAGITGVTSVFLLLI